MRRECQNESDTRRKSVRGNGIQHGLVWRVTLIRTAKALKGNSLLSASWCIVSQGRKQQHGTTPMRGQLEAPGAEKGSLLRSCFVGCEKVMLKDSSPPPLRKGVPSFLKHVAAQIPQHQQLKKSKHLQNWIKTHQISKSVL